VFAHADFPFPNQLLRQTFARVDPAFDPETYDRDRMTWALMHLIPAHLEDERLAPLARYLSAGTHEPDDRRRRFQLSERIAHTFDQYLVFRPALLRDWERDEIDVDDWQPVLWKALVGVLGPNHTAAMERRAITALRDGDFDREGLARRVCLFGISTLPPLHVRVLDALARHVDVHLFQLTPTDEYWADIEHPRAIHRRVKAARSRRPNRVPDTQLPLPLGQAEPTPGRMAEAPPRTLSADELHYTVGHPLLAGFGKLGKEFQTVLIDELADFQGAEGRFESPHEGSLLGVLQADLYKVRYRREDRPQVPPVAIPATDRTVEVHVCHSPRREVEVLHDQIRAMLEANPSWTPEDILVMSPDIELYAPLIDATFGAAPYDRRIPHSVADRSPRRESPVIEAFLAVLGLIGARGTATEVTDLLTLTPIRDRFGIAPSDLELIHRWVADSGVRWGVDAAHRAGFGLPEFGENTWRFGLDRLLVGYAMHDAPPRLWAGVRPYDDVEGSDALRVGRFVDFVEALFGALERLEGDRPLQRWRADLGAMLSRLVDGTGDNEHAHQLIRDTLAEVVEAAEAAGFDELVGPDLVRTLLVRRFEEGRHGHRFLSGGVTFCAMLPMRSIPFRVICMLGMNERDFPRTRRPLGFDRMARSPRAGDRSLRDDDRYLFLEAILSARDRLLVTYVGRSVRDDTARPPSVAVGELLDALDEAFRTADGGPIRPQIVVEHPLQPFSARAFDPATDRRQRSHDGAWCEVATALQGPRAPLPAFLPDALAPPEDDDGRIDLEALARFFRRPQASLLRRRLGVDLTNDPLRLRDREPVSMDALERWSLGEALVEARLTGADVEALHAATRALGSLPVGTVGDCAFEDIAETAGRIAERIAEVADRPPRQAIDVDIPLGDGRRVVGRLDGLRDGLLLRYGFGRLDGRRRMDLWLRHLALNAHADTQSADDFGDLMGGMIGGEPEPGGAIPRTSRFVCRADRQAAAVALEFPPQANAIAVLRELVDIYARGMCEPIPLFTHASFAYASARRKRPWRSRDARERSAGYEARNVWKGYGDLPADRKDPATLRLFGDQFPFDDEFVSLARAVFDPLLDAGKNV
jgi:exodeoxyribonuclease V gamma subunit